MIFVDEAAVLFVDADDAVDDGVRARFEFVVVRLDGDRYSIVELRRVRELRGVWRDIARDFGSPPRGVTGPPDDDVTEPAVFDTGEGLSVVLPDTHPAACGYETMAAAPSRGRVTHFPAAAPEPEAPPPAQTVETAFNAEFENHDDRQPLVENTAYVLAFYTGEPDPNASVSVPTTIVFEEGEADVKLTIQLTSDDFAIDEPSQELTVKRDGKSRGRARFGVTPQHEGRCVLHATVLKDGNFVQQIAIATNVGVPGTAMAEVTSAGRKFTPDETIRPRDLAIVVEQTPTGGLRMTLGGKEGPISGTTEMTPEQLDSLIADLRKSLKTIIDETFDDAAHKVAYTEAIDVAPAIRDATLEKLAEESFFVFRTIFHGPGADEGMKKIGAVLAGLDAATPRDIQVVTRRFAIPWQLLYAARKLEPIDARRFLGFSHRIEHIALETGWNVRQAEIRHDANLRIGVNVNRGIDEEMEATYVADQLAFFESLGESGKVRIEVRDTVKAVKNALTDPDLPDQLVYLYCHAKSNALNEGVGNSELQFEGTKPLTLKTLRNASDPDTPFRSAPLVFINACQSAELSPLFYDGFVPQLTQQGARGVIGTECDTPAIFAAAWAQEFFTEFLGGKELGDVMLTLRQRFLEQRKNPMGLLYAVHCNGNTRVEPGVGLSAS
ncbi:MAG TPA: CHAT domain-containing protein [Thermoanaerobaculia bacterium]